MAKQEHLALLRQGVKAWNAWRATSKDVPDLSDADLARRNLEGVNLSFANIRTANLQRARLRRANLNHSDLSGSNIEDSTLVRASLIGANLDNCRLHGTNLRDAKISDASARNADLSKTDCTNVDFTRTYLVSSNLSGAKLDRADLTGARLTIALLKHTSLDGTIFASSVWGGTAVASVDLRTAVDLERSVHRGPSSLAIDTLRLSRGRIDSVFLRGCGLTDQEVLAVKLWNTELSSDQLLDAMYQLVHAQLSNPIQAKSVFISYSRSDSEFVDAFETILNTHGIRYWRDVHDLVSGRIETQIDQAIRLNPLVVLVLSRHSVSSDWVEWEASRARELEKEHPIDTLCPIALDDAWKNSRWSAPLRKQIEKYHILDFSNWRDPVALSAQSIRLVKGLHIFYAKRQSGTFV